MLQIQTGKMDVKSTKIKTYKIWVRNFIKQLGELHR